MQEEKRATEEEMVGWSHPFNGHEFEQEIMMQENMKERESWCPAVLGVTKSWT